MLRSSACAAALLVSLLSFATPHQAPAQRTPTAAAPELAELIDVRLLTADFYDKQVFLLGEAHGVQKPQELDFALLKHLNQRLGLRYYLAEVDQPKAYYLNEYLRTGDEAQLKRVFRSWVQQHQQWGNRDFYQKVQRIRQLNQSLPRARRIRFVGIDGLQDFSLAGEFLALRARSQPLPVALQLRLDSVAHHLRLGRPEVAQAARALEHLGHTPSARLAPLYNELRHLLTNVAYAGRKPGGREDVLHANFLALYQQLNLANEKLYGMWGLAHVLQGPIQRAALPLAARLQQAPSPVKARVVSLLCTYSGCRMMYPSQGLPAAWRTPGQPFTSTDKFNHDGPLVRVVGIDSLKAASRPSAVTLFPTANFGRPLQVTYAPQMPPEQQMRLDDRLPAAAYVQYLLLVRDSDMTQPLLP
ncbi:erythromycin esterase family protein [Hymenobacter oligotrophus]|nr:erythromycin esterase family protein [Hymenobacter oligotrophus]